MPSSWRRKYGWNIRECDGWLIGTTSRLYAGFSLILLPFLITLANARLASPSGRSDFASIVINVFGGIAVVVAILMIGLTNEVRVNLTNGAVRTRRGLFGLTRTHDFIRPQIDGIFMTIHEDARHPQRHFCAIGFQAGLGRWAMYRTMDSDRAVAFYRELRDVTGYPGVQGF